MLIAGCGHFEVTVKAYGVKGAQSTNTISGGGTTLASYNTLTKEVTLLDINRYKHILRTFKNQFFPDTTIDPKIEDSKRFDREEFYRMCSLIVEIPQCR